MVAAPAMTTRSISKPEMSSSPSYLHPNDLHGLETAVASGSGSGNSLTRAPECRVVLEELLPYEELLKSTSPVSLRVGISRLESAQRRQRAELEGVARTVKEHDNLMKDILSEFYEALNELNGGPREETGEGRGGDRTDAEVEEAAQRVARSSLKDLSHEVGRDVMGDK